MESRDSTDPPICACGFFGSAEREGMCSKCWRDARGSAENAAPATPSPEASVPMDAEPLATPPVAPAPTEAPGAPAAAAAPASPLPPAPDAEMPLTPAAASAPESAAAAAAAAAGASAPEEPARKKQKNRKRCFSCKKKVGLTGLECRCGYVYCAEHRMPYEHSCSFDFKAHDREVLAEQNQRVAADKVLRV